MTPRFRPRPVSLVLSYEETAGALLAAHAPFDPGSLVRAIWLRAARLPGFTEGFGGTVLDRGDPATEDEPSTAGPYRARLTAARVRDIVLPLPALDLLTERIRATGLPERVPSLRARVDTSDGWAAHRLSLVWDDLPPVQLVAHAMSSGYEGPDAAAVDALFRHLVALGRSAATR